MTCTRPALAAGTRGTRLDPLSPDYREVVLDRMSRQKFKAGGATGDLGWRASRGSFTTNLVPGIELFKPGQPAPYSAFPYLAVAIGAAAWVIGWITVRRHPSTGSGEGTLFTEP
jgi:hypothetical protein